VLLEITDLYGGYGAEDIIKGVSFTADEGEVLCLVGPNGCGKSTLFRLILRSLQATGGIIQIDGKDTQSLSPKALANLIAYIPQQHTPIFTYTVLDIVIMGRASHFSAFETPKPVDRDAAFDALKAMGIEHLANRTYTSLSGGQRQMIIIARAICQSAKIFVMDEPAANLDYANQQLLMDVITALAEKGYLVIMSTHNPEHLFTVGQKVILMHEGRVAAFGKPDEVITSGILEEIYGIEMDIVKVTDRHGKTRTICLPVKPVTDHA
jgi:iron complex transport system ATP-binding protein